MFTYFANPKRFKNLSALLLPVFIVLSCILLPWGLYQSLIASPPDYQQGEMVRFMYFHVPAAWMALFIYISMTIASIMGFVWRHMMADLYTKAAAPFGAFFTALCLVTGMLWGKPMWGAYWVWDARLTSVLILFFMYLGYMALVNAFENEERGLRAGAILVIIGFINIPVIKFSVDWWSTLHQPASISSLRRIAHPALAPEMLTPLLIMAGAFMTLFGAAVLIRLNHLLKKRRAAARQAL